MRSRSFCMHVVRADPSLNIGRKWAFIACVILYLQKKNVHSAPYSKLFALQIFTCINFWSAVSGVKRRCKMIHPMITPVVAIVAGVLILIFPELLNIVVAIYLIAIGIMGIMGTL